MTDDQFPRDVDDDVDPEDLALVEQLLGDLAFLRPEGAPAGSSASAEPMPDWAWTRISDALAAEHAEPRRPSRLARWGGGLVAASVAVVAIAVGVTAFQGDDGSLVATDALPTSFDVAADDAGAAPALAQEAGPSPVAALPTAPAKMSFAGMVPPALRVLNSDTDYTASDLRSQVSTVMDSEGLTPTVAPREMAAAPEEIAMSGGWSDGFMASARSLRDCVTKLTHEKASTALMVDRSTFEGIDAGVIVAPEYVSAGERSEPLWQTMEIWVVDPNCEIRMAMRFSVSR